MIENKFQMEDENVLPCLYEINSEGVIGNAEEQTKTKQTEDWMAKINGRTDEVQNEL